MITPPDHVNALPTAHTSPMPIMPAREKSRHYRLIARSIIGAAFCHNLSMSNASTRARIQFVVELAPRLHQYGATAARLEAAIDSVSARLDLECNSLSTPTSIILSFSDRSRGEGALAEI